jgi:hypothetical protein
MKGNQCDNCRKFSKNEHGWFAIIQYVEAAWGNPFSGPAYQIEGTFCSMKCLAELSYAFVVAHDAAEAQSAD